MFKKKDRKKFVFTTKKKKVLHGIIAIIAGFFAGLAGPKLARDVGIIQNVAQVVVEAIPSVEEPVVEIEEAVEEVDTDKK